MKDASKGANPATTEIELLTPKEAAVLLRLSESFLAKARMRGDGPRYRKLSRAVRYSRADLVLWLKASAKTSTAEWDGGNRRDQIAASDEDGTSRKEEE
jgi:hypothetical protein